MNSRINTFYAGSATCPATGKAIHETKRDARKVRNRLRGGGALSIYRCEACNGYHLGHQPASVRAGRYDKSDWLGEA